MATGSSKAPGVISGDAGASGSSNSASAVNTTAAATNVPQNASVAPAQDVRPVSSAGTASSGLVRPRRRAVPNAKPNSMLTGYTKRSYGVANAPVFQNHVEMSNDMISPEYAQEILEEFFEHCDMPTSDPHAMRAAEDIVFLHIILNGASQATSYERVIDIGDKELDLSKLMRLFVNHKVTPRQFSRGIAARLHAFIKEPENGELRATLIQRHSLESLDHASIAFDGSTHIPFLSGPLREMAKILSSKGLAENFASEKLSTERSGYVTTRNNATVHNTFTPSID